MNKEEAIKEYVLKEQMEEDEAEFYADQYAGDLTMQHNDNEDRIKPFISNIQDLSYELNKLKEIKKKLDDYNEYQTPYTESVRLISNVFNKGIEDLKDKINVMTFEMKQILEV